MGLCIGVSIIECLCDGPISPHSATLQLNVTGLGELNSVLAKELEEVVEHAKPQIIAGLPTTISRAVMEEANKNILESIPQLQKSKPCHLTTLTPKLNTSTIYNASRVSVTGSGSG